MQARISSRRLPGKVLAQICGKPLLAFAIERLQRCPSVAGVTVATSDRPEDDAVEELALRVGASVLRGSLDDVLERFVTLGRAADAGPLVRVSGDSPLIDPAIVERVVQRFFDEPCDIATNVWPRSFPKGQSVEVMTVAALERAQTRTFDPEDREHVTRFFYRNAAEFRICSVIMQPDLSAVQLSVDEPADLELVRRIVAAMSRPHWTYGLDDVLALRAQVLADKSANTRS